MRKNGFTLIELLAVIVILAIIALIATPIILGIINDAREKANERSVELYASAVKNGIAAYQLVEGKEVASGTYTSESLPFEVEYDGKVDCTTVIISEHGKVSLEGCTVNGSEKTYSYGTKQGTSIEVGTMGICNPISVQVEGAYTAGDKYECDVDPDKEGYDYMFYILNMDSTSVNLIMDSNINISGEAVKSNTMEDKGFVAWITREDYISEEIGGDPDYWDFEEGVNDKGPITVMNYLQTATAGWSNAKPQTISTFYNCVYGDNCEEKNMAKTYTVNARMPYYSEIDNSNGTNEYLYENLDGSEWYGSGTQPTNNISEIWGYWTLSSSSPSNFAWFVFSYGIVYDSEYHIQTADSFGIRPVINLSI